MSYVHKILSTWKRYKFQFTTVQETGKSYQNSSDFFVWTLEKI